VRSLTAAVAPGGFGVQRIKRPGRGVGLGGAGGGAGRAGRGGPARAGHAEGAEHERKDRREEQATLFHGLAPCPLFPASLPATALAPRQEIGSMVRRIAPSLCNSGAQVSWWALFPGGTRATRSIRITWEVSPRWPCLARAGAGRGRNYKPSRSF